MSLFWLLAVAAMQASGAAPPPSGEVTVTARAANLEADALAACLARRCPPDEDIAATLALATRHFLDGDYAQARTVLAASRGRNGGFAKTFPEPVSRLHGTYARIAQHQGDGDAAWNGRLAALGALKAGLAKDDPRVLIERLALGDSYLFANRPEAALQEYDAVAALAHRRAQPSVEGAALTRRAATLVALASRDPVARGSAKQALRALLQRREPAFAEHVTTARALQAQLDGSTDPRARDAAIAAFRPAARTGTAQLLYAPPIDLNTAGAAGEMGTSTLGQLATDSFEDQWIDVAFEIDADGRVGDVAITRQSPKLDAGWTKLVVASIAGRRYAPMRIEAGSVVARLERYTYTALWETRTSSRMRVRDAKPILQMVDLSR